MTIQSSLNLGLMFGALVVVGCRVGPDYKVPAITAPPTAFSEDGHNDGWTAATPADTTDRGDWWAVYKNAELDGLEQQCATANQSLAAALHTYEQAHDIVSATRASLYPTVGISAGVQFENVSSTRPLHGVNPLTQDWDFLVPLSISWAPDFFGSVHRQIESSATAAQATAADLATTRLALQGTLAVFFFQIRGIDLQAQLLRTTLDAYTQALQLTEDRRTGGLASQIDVEQARTQLEQTRSQLVDLGVGRAQYEHAIALLIGVPATNYHITERALAGNPPGIPTGIPSQLLQRRPDIAAAERRVASANALVGVAKAAYYPNVTISIGSGVESDRVGELLNEGSAIWNAGLSATEILYDAGRRRAHLNQAVAQREQFAALYREQVLSAFRDVEDQLAALRILDEEAIVTARAVESARRSTELSTILYRGGLATYLEVLTNQTIELTNERNAAALMARRIVASAQLEMALGGGWDASQLPVN
jgi:NodT family efflux transporter outer membrane factor (OMF) lipoprotein